MHVALPFTAPDVPRRVLPARFAGLLALTLTMLSAVTGLHAAGPTDDAFDDFDDFAPVQVGITPQMPGVGVLHGEAYVWVERDQNQEARIVDDYALTSRACPPFCIQPMVVADGVRTLGELETLEFMVRLGRNDTLLLVDARSNAEYRDSALPGAINVPWTDLVTAVGAVDFIIEERLDDFGVRLEQGSGDLIADARAADYSGAKTLVVYDNGPWCGQAPSKIRALLAMGYPAERIHWYRGGLQAWRGLGLTVIDPLAPPTADR